MKAKFKVGDLVTVNSKYLREGLRYFGKELKHRNLKGKIIKVFENINDEKDGHGDIWCNFYEFADNVHICEMFLQLA
jgi:hypothetical protein